MPVKPFTICCFGTSLSTGPSSHEWLGVACSAIAAGKNRPVRGYTLGKPGQNSAWGVSNVGPVARLNADVVLIEFIMNDAYTGSSMSLGTSQSNAASIISAIQAGSPASQIYLMTMNPVYNRTDRPNMASYNAMYASLASSLGVGFIDNYPLWGTVTVGMFDDGSGIHPSLSAIKSVMIPNVVSVIAPLLT